MTAWSISDAAAGVVGTAATHALKFNGKIKTLDQALPSGTSELQHSPRVVMALGDLVTQALTPYLKGVTGHTSSAIQGTQDAIDAYHRGDRSMFDNAQDNATKATYPATMPGKGPSSAVRPRASGR